VFDETVEISAGWEEPLRKPRRRSRVEEETEENVTGE
jgi:hypothetical protein